MTSSILGVAILGRTILGQITSPTLSFNPYKEGASPFGKTRGVYSEKEGVFSAKRNIFLEKINPYRVIK